MVIYAWWPAMVSGNFCGGWRKQQMRKTLWCSSRIEFKVITCRWVDSHKCSNTVLSNLSALRRILQDAHSHGMWICTHGFGCWNSCNAISCKVCSQQETFCQFRDNLSHQLSTAGSPIHCAHYAIWVGVIEQSACILWETWKPGVSGILAIS